MIIEVSKNIVKIREKNGIHSGEYKINECVFEFSEEYLASYVKKALFIGEDDVPYEMVIVGNRCEIPYEVLKDTQYVRLGVYAYEERNGELELRYSPESTKFLVDEGSYIENAKSPTRPTIDEFAQYYQAMQELINNIPSGGGSGGSSASYLNETLIFSQGASVNAEVLEV